MITTSTPFDLPIEHHGMLPPARGDGLILADIKVEGHWDGILVIDGHRCIGVYVGRKVIHWDISFDPNDIEDYRAASIWNRFLAFLPPLLLSPYPIVWIICPILMAIGYFVSYWVLIVVPFLTVISILRMYSGKGFPLIRLPSALFGGNLSLIALFMFISILRK